jgi:hypothetical protein
MGKRSIHTVVYKGKRVPVSEYIKAERDAIGVALQLFHMQFSELDSELGTLLHSILSNRPTMVPFAIYFSVDSLGARLNMVDSAVIEAVGEHRKLLGPLMNETRWPYILARLRKIRDSRNLVAHSSIKNIDIRNRLYIRLMAPTLDTRVTRVIAKRQIPGMTSDELTERTQPISTIKDCIDRVGAIFQDVIAAKGASLPLRFRELEDSLTRLRNLYPTVPKQPKQPRQHRPSSASRRKAALKRAGRS